jgi:SAM-dependent methyltransferase
MFAAEEAQWWYVGMRRISDALLGAGPRAADGPPRLLDAGCGTGQNLRHYAGRGLGVDLSPEALRACRRRGVSAVRGSVLGLPVRSGSADLATSFDVIYHGWVEDDAAALRELHRVLRPGGLLLLRVPALEMLRGAHDQAVHTRRRYTLSGLRRRLAGAGFEVRRLTYANCFLFPLLALRRTLDRWGGRQGSDVEFLPAPLEWLFLRLLTLEAALVARGLRLPIGASVMALARKPERVQSAR